MTADRIVLLRQIFVALQPCVTDDIEEMLFALQLNGVDYNAFKLVLVRIQKVSKDRV